MNDLRRTASEWLRSGIDGVRVTIVRAGGSTPQPAGAAMLVSSQRLAGTIGGGRLEWTAIERARERLAARADRAGEPDCWNESLALGPALGQCCGGSVELRYERLDTDMVARWPDERVVFELDLFGMGHVASALVGTLSPVACVIRWHDERPEFFDDTRSRIERSSQRAHIECHEFASAPPSMRARSLGPPAFALVMTHSHALDLDLCETLLRQDHWAFIGLIGSASKRVRFERRLEARGFSAAQRARLVCPIGLPGLRLKQPELLAISIAAQLLQRAGPEAGPATRAADAIAPLLEHP